MSYNHGIEEKRFKGRWEQQEKLFRQNGMTDEQIAALRKFDEERYKKLIKVPQIMRKAFYMYKALGLFQNEISSKLSIPQQTISYWIIKIAEILK